MKKLIFISVVLGLGLSMFAGITVKATSVWFIPDNFPDLRTAYDEAESHDTIIVRPGYYAGDNWTEIFFFDKPVRVVSEGGPYVTTIDGRGIDRGIHFRDLYDNSMLFEGFTITNCVGEFIGGVTFHENSSGTLRNCIIENCRTTGSYPPVPSEGAGLRIWGASPIIENVIIRDCHAEQGGGCNILVNSSPIFRNVRIENCSGGALLASEYCDPYFEDCQFLNCTSSSISFTAGVGIYTGGQGHFVRCLIEGNNNLLDNCGGVHIGNSTTVFDHCMFINNTAVGLAAGILCHEGASPVFNYCTIAGNSAGTNGDGIGVFGNSTPVFNNCIIWQPGSELYSETGGTASFFNCDISTDIGSSDNFSEDPMFTGDNFHIQTSSPCQDRGRDTGERIDIDGDWIEDPMEIWDVGADEIFSADSGNIILSLQMPSKCFSPGAPFMLNAELKNEGSGIFQAVLVIVLDVYGDFYMWPSWSPYFDRDTIQVPSNTSVVPIIPLFNWPTGAGSASGLFFHGGLMSHDLTQILSNIDSIGFGWTQ
ncbi:right-handed parallel beta-helix repeat-containing protein [bacterium]|nr:right-handed parallel beta-helix repeat-containing protein [bacterium]